MNYGLTVSLLRRVPIFASMEAGPLKLLAFSSTHLTVERGEIICHEGDPADGVYIIDEGHVEVSVVRRGQEVTVASVGPHEVVGEIAVILNQPRTATLRALEPVKLVKIDADIFLSTISGNGDAALGVLRTLCERLSSMLQHYQALSGNADQAG